MDAVQQFFRSVGAVRLAVIGGLLVALVAFLVWLIGRLSGTEFALLYGDLDMADSARAVAVLESEGVPHKLADGGATIKVPADMVPRARLKLADKGLPTGGSVGYELFDSRDALGTTSFSQNVNLVRALEGELARTIRSIEGVQAARVHLVLPKRETFSREQQRPSASVVLTTRGGRRLLGDQVMAVQHLVASAVPGLVPSRISVVDDKGTLLAGGFEDAGGTAAFNAKVEQQRSRYETQLARTVEQLLERTVGYGRVRAEVTAEMDFDRINTSEEIFDPESQVVRSTQAVEQTSSNREGGGPPPVSVATNLPDADVMPGDAGGGGVQNEKRSEETTNYEISKKVINHVREAGIVKRLSVAVLVDGTYGPGGEGTPAYQPRSQEELNLLATLVRSAIGFDAARGDTVEVVNMRFVDLEPAGDAPAAVLMGLNKNDLLNLVQYVVLVLFVLLVVLLVVRPLLTRVLETLPAASGRGAGGDLLAAPTTETPALAPPPGASGAQAALERPPGDDQLEEMVDLDRVEGRVRASMVKKVGEIVDKHPDEALTILRVWLQERA